MMSHGPWLREGRSIMKNKKVMMPLKVLGCPSSCPFMSPLLKLCLFPKGNFFCNKERSKTPHTKCPRLETYFFRAVSCELCLKGTTIHFAGAPQNKEYGGWSN